MIIKFYYIILLLFTLTLRSTASAENELTRELLLGKIIKTRLEELHFDKKLLNDDLSKKAFDQYIKRVDSGKQYLLQKEVNELKKYKNEIDDEFDSGDFELLNKTTTLLKERTKEIKGWVFELFKKDFNFKKKEFIETDPDKRKFVKNKKQLKALWKKIVKQSVLNKYLDLIDEQENFVAEVKPDKKNKKKKKGKTKLKKKKSLKEMRKEAVAATLKSYKSIFSRLAKQDYETHLERFLNSVATVYDPHTLYFSPDKKEDFDIEMKGSLEGIGAVLQEDGSYIKVVRIVPGSASWRQKQLESEDKILKVGQADSDSVDIFDMRLRDVVKLIRGPKGTEVRLTVKKTDGRVIVIPIVRDIVKIEESFAKSTVIEHKKLKLKIGFIHVPRFYRDFTAKRGKARNCTDDVKNELQKLVKKKVDGIILDLRSNGGGALEDAINMSGLFIKSGPIVQVKNHNGRVRISNDQDPSVIYDGPLIVLINKFSASASEILAAALQDYGRAVIIGSEHSHGKGTVQTIIDLDRGLPSDVSHLVPLGALKITIQKFYRITGGSTQYNGVTPQIVIPDTFGYVESGEKELDYSLPWDELPPLEFKKWAFKNKKGFSFKKIINKSIKRIKKNSKFKKVLEKISFMKKRREQTKVTLRMADLKKQRKSDEVTLKSFDGFDLNSSIVMFDENNKPVKFKKEDKSKKNKKKKKPNNEDPKHEWLKNLNKDPVVEETIFVLKDMIAELK